MNISINRSSMLLHVRLHLFIFRSLCSYMFGFARVYIWLLYYTICNIIKLARVKLYHVDHEMHGIYDAQK